MKERISDIVKNSSPATKAFALIIIILIIGIILRWDIIYKDIIKGFQFFSK